MRDEDSEGRLKSTSYALSSDKKIIEPSESFSQEVQIQVPKHAADLDSQPVQSTVPQGSITMSASESLVNRFPRGLWLKKFLKPALMLGVLLVVALAAWLAYRSSTGYGVKTLQTNGVNFSIYFDKRAKRVVADGGTYVSGKDPVSGAVIYLAVGKSEQTKYDCQANTTGTTKVIDQPVIEGREHNLCLAHAYGDRYDINFTHDNEWYYLTFFPGDTNSTAKIDESTAKSIAASVHIN